MSPSTRTLPSPSFRRFTERRSVDFPQPDGPMCAVTLPRGIRMSLSQRARVFPYQRLKRSTSSTAASALTASCVSVSASGGAMFIRRTVVSMVRLAMRASEVPDQELSSEPCAHADRSDVEHDDDRDEEERRREHHRFRSLAVLALEAEIVDVEAEMHEAALEMDERERAIDRKPRELHRSDEHQ